MADLWVVVTVLGFFGLCVALVRGCDSIIGPDDSEELAPRADAEAEREPAEVAP